MTTTPDLEEERRRLLLAGCDFKQARSTVGRRETAPVVSPPPIMAAAAEIAVVVERTLARVPGCKLLTCLNCLTGSR
jgi:hypothetical protein